MHLPKWISTKEKTEDIERFEDEGGAIVSEPDVAEDILMNELNKHVLAGTLDRLTATRLGARATKAGNTEVARRVNAFIKKM